MTFTIWILMEHLFGFQIFPILGDLEFGSTKYQIKETSKQQAD